MRLLFLSKRRPQQRDLVERPYGRFFHLPTLLSRAGHVVQVALCSHAGLPSMAGERGGVQWTSHDLRTLGPLSLIARLEQDAATFRPDWVIGCSDIVYGWMARRFARRSGARFAVDAYDNYEAYMPWNLPLHAVWRSVVATAHVVTAAGPQLAERLDAHRQGRQPAHIVPMAADPAFVPHHQEESRLALGLPLDAPLIGYMGGWAQNRGTAALIDAFRQVRALRPNARLLLTGRPPAWVIKEPGALPLGYIEDSMLPIALSALDVATVITADTSFGRFSYPAKLCEAIACHVPVAATATEPVRWMLNNDDRVLAAVDEPGQLALRILELLDGPRRISYSSTPTWEDGARRMEAALGGA